jgi:hypothetical protein
MIHHFSIKTTVSANLLKKSLLKGSLLGLAGVAGLLYGALFLHVNELNTWGLLLFLGSLAAITGGLLPYRQLTRLQLNPHRLILSENETLDYYLKEKMVMSIPTQSIEKIAYLSNEGEYGIIFSLKKQPSPPVKVYAALKEVEQMRQDGEKLGKGDLFFRYFNERAFKELSKALAE